MSASPRRDADERLADWVDGRMSARERERFTGELRVNPQLRADLEAYERTVGALRAALRAPVAPPVAPSGTSMADRVLAALDGGGAARKPARGKPSWRLVRWSIASAAALLLLALWVDSWGPDAAIDERTSAALDAERVLAPRGDQPSDGPGDQPGDDAAADGRAGEPTHERMGDGRIGEPVREQAGEQRGEQPGEPGEPSGEPRDPSLPGAANAAPGASPAPASERSAAAPAETAVPMRGPEDLGPAAPKSRAAADALDPAPGAKPEAGSAREPGAAPAPGGAVPRPTPAVVPQPAPAAVPPLPAAGTEARPAVPATGADDFFLGRARQTPAPSAGAPSPAAGAERQQPGVVPEARVAPSSERAAPDVGVLTGPASPEAPRSKAAAPAPTGPARGAPGAPTPPAAPMRDGVAGLAPSGPATGGPPVAAGPAAPTDPAGAAATPGRSAVVPDGVRSSGNVPKPGARTAPAAPLLLAFVEVEGALGSPAPEPADKRSDGARGEGEVRDQRRGAPAPSGDGGNAAPRAKELAETANVGATGPSGAAAAEPALDLPGLQRALDDFLAAAAARDTAPAAVRWRTTRGELAASPWLGPLPEPAPAAGAGAADARPADVRTWLIEGDPHDVQQLLARAASFAADRGWPLRSGEAPVPAELVRHDAGPIGGGELSPPPVAPGATRQEPAGATPPLPRVTAPAGPTPAPPQPPRADAPAGAAGPAARSAPAERMRLLLRLRLHQR